MRRHPGQPLPADADLPAVDHAGGIARLMGDGVLFARVLGRFRDEYREAGAGIRAALDAGDLALALRRVHTLKGAAGMIEAVPLRRRAQALEQLLRAGGADVPHGLAQLQEELGRVLAHLDALAPTQPRQPSGPAQPTPAPAAQQHALERLMFLLDEGNGDAVDLVRDAEAALTARLGAPAYLELAGAIEMFDFDGALERLRRHARR